MRIEIELTGYGGYGWKVCDGCPCHYQGEFGAACGMGYYDHNTLAEDAGGVYWNWRIDVETGEVAGGDSKTGVDCYRRPQECIDKHGR